MSTVVKAAAQQWWFTYVWSVPFASAFLTFMVVK